MPTEETSAEIPTFVIAIDGLRAAALGCYGQTGYGTPGFDRLAVESVVYDSAYAQTPDPRDLYRDLTGWLSSRSAVLITDEAAIATDTPAFDRHSVVERGRAQAPAETVGETTTAAAWAAFAEALAEEVTAGEEAATPPLLWFHTRGLQGPWDAPRELMAPLLDEDDPEIGDSVEPPHDHLDADPDNDPADLRFAASCRYAAEVMTLDACFDSWLDLLEGLMEGRDYRLVVMGLRGFALGEHGRITGEDDRLFSELQHVPLLIRDTAADRRFVRDGGLVTLGSVLAPQASGPEPNMGMVSPTTAAVRTPDWFLRCANGAEAELYVKPDDRWEQNNIASLREEIAEELLATLSPPG